MKKIKVFVLIVLLCTAGELLSNNQDVPANNKLLTANIEALTDQEFNWDYTCWVTYRRCDRCGWDWILDCDDRYGETGYGDCKPCGHWNVCTSCSYDITDY